MSTPSIVEDVFLAALEKCSPEERAAYLDESCRGDLDLRRRVERLLHANSKAGGFLEQPAADLVATADSAPDRGGRDEGTVETVGSAIGPYKLLQKLGEGGMGTVWIAEQAAPVKRRVALKVIKAGMDSAQILRRFEAERQALALMEHTHIAKVFDAGTTASGRPYFVMELVHGVPLTKYCDELHVPIRERLELFVPVCQAIQHAHQKGIIHRDVKPSNVLVCMQDGRPVPKIIDFGVAKATGRHLTEGTLFTEYGAVVGTLEYMAPEQAEMSPLGVDTRADVYALGVLLYELLTGTTPLDRARLRGAAYTEMVRLIKEEEPPRPSTRLTESKESLAGLAALRRTDPAQLTRDVRGDLDWIVMKCLEKDRTRRYETANALVRDVERHLHDDPVEACPPAAGYRLRKALRRHKGPVLAAALVLLALLVGLVGLAWGLVQADEGRRLAEHREQQAHAAALAEAQAKQEALDHKRQAEQAALAERSAKQSAQKRLAQLEKGNQILESIFQDLDPNEEEKEGKPLRVLLGERLQRAVKQLEGEAVGDSLAVARLQTTLGTSLFALRYSEQAMDLLSKARATFTAHLGADHADTLVALHNLARACFAAGKLDLAVPLFEEALRLRQAKLGPDHHDTLAVMCNLGNAYQAAGKLKLPLLEETVKLMKAKLGPDHRDTLVSMNNLARGYRAAGKLNLALPLFEETLKLQKAKLGPDHPHTLMTMNNLASTSWAAGKLDKALPLFEETLRLRKTKLGPDHPDTLHSMSNLANAYRASGKLDLALFEETLKLMKAKLGPDHPSTLTGMNNLASAYQAAGKMDLALPLFEETLKLRKSTQGPDHPETLVTMCNLALAYQDAGKLDKALPLFEEAAVGVEKLQFVHQHAGGIVGYLIVYHEQMQHFDRAEIWRRKWLAVVKDRSGAESTAHAGELAALGLNLLEQKKFADAEPVLRECLTIRAKAKPNDWTTFNTKSMLGGALLGQKKYAAAEPLLLQGYEGMIQGKAKIPPQVKDLRLREALARLVQLYDGWGKPDEAAKWRKALGRRADLRTLQVLQGTWLLPRPSINV